jgi:hypothetical protein
MVLSTSIIQTFTFAIILQLHNHGLKHGIW